MTKEKQTCQALNMDGKRCKNKAVYVEHYHGSDELYHNFDEKPTWVEIVVCRKHQITPEHSENFVRRLEEE